MNSSFHEIHLHLSQAAAQEVTNLLDQNVLPDLSGYYEILYEENRPSGDDTTLVLYFPSDCEDGRWELEALLLAHEFHYHLEERAVTESDYQEAYKEHYRPFVVGDRFAIIPSWYKGTEEEERFQKRNRIYLDPGLAFGTGLHATTRMMIRWLENNPPQGLKVLDAGCGSGILTIAALQLGARQMLAFDVDGNAVHASESNLTLNFPDGYPANIRKSGWELPEIQGFAPDLTLANITLNTFLTAREIISCLPGKLVVSGIIEEQKQDFLDAFPMWKLMSEIQDDGWLVMELDKA